MALNALSISNLEQLASKGLSLVITIKLEVIGSVHDVRAVAVIQSVLNHLVDDNSVQIDDVVQECRVHRALHIKLVSSTQTLPSSKSSNSGERTGENGEKWGVRIPTCPQDH